MWQRRLPPSVLFATLLYGLMAWIVANNLGLVGEVALGWSANQPPNVLVSVSPNLWADGTAQASAGDQFGPLVANQVRPLEQIVVAGQWRLPLAINLYTGGMPDWPARLLFLLTQSPNAVLVFHVLLGGGLLMLVHRFLWFHGTPAIAGFAALLLATDWTFVFYKRALGGTEIALQGALLLCLWGLWSRRWGGGRHGLWPLALGAAIGLSAKLTFLVPLVALLAAAFVLRQDHAHNQPPTSGHLSAMLAAVGLIVLPLCITIAHHRSLGDLPHIRSHDFPNLQLQRVLGALSGEQGPSREGMENLLYWLVHPLGFFTPAYGVADTGQPSLWRVLGWLVVLVGSVDGWRDPHRGPTQALLRLMSVLVPIQVLGLWLVARDLHHLAMLAPMVAIWSGLAIGQLAGRWAPSRSLRHAGLGVLFALPWLGANIHTIIRTDAVLDQIATPTFTAQGQQALVSMLRTHGVHRLVACDYELYGVLETLAPDVTVLHGWGAASHQRGDVLPELLHLATDGHLLVVQASAPMIYNLRPSRGQLITLANQEGLAVEVVDHLPDQTAVLYRVWQP